MRYLIALPICIFLISGGVWLISRGGFFTAPAQELSAAVGIFNDSNNTVAATTRPRLPTVHLNDDESSTAFDPILITPCTLAPIREQVVSSQLDGILNKLCVKLGQHVKIGECLGNLDDRKLRLQVQLLEIRAHSQSAERIATALYNEADAKVQYAERANRGGLQSVPPLEYKTYLAQRERFAQEIKKAREDREAALKEMEKAKLLLDMHSLKSQLTGEVTKVFRQEGETVKQAEPLFRIVQTNRLLVEGFCKVQHAGRLRPGMRVLLEPELQGAQIVELIGHTAAVHDLAMSSNGEFVASAGADNAVLLWSWPDGRRLATISHPAAVHAVALAPSMDADKNATGYQLASGCADHMVRIWHVSLDGKVSGPRWTLKGHNRTVRAICLSPDGRHCVSGGEDRKIGWWDVNSGRRVYWVHHLGAWKQSAHQGGLTAVQLTQDGTLVSTGSDNVVKVWQLKKQRAKLIKTHRGRTGDVHRLDVSPDGNSILFDHGEELRILQRDRGSVLGTLQSNKNLRFKEFTCFSPSGRLVLSASANGRIQLWRTPAPPKQRGKLLALATQTNIPPRPLDFDGLRHLGGFEIRHYTVPKAADIQCGLFAPSERVFFTGASDRLIRVWRIPDPVDWLPREAKVTYIGNEIEQGTDLVRVQAELANDDRGPRRLRPGTFVTLKIYPQKMDR